MGAATTGISRSSYRRLVRELGYHAYRPQLKFELSDDDYDRRMEFCEQWIPKLEEEPGLLDHIMWSDESDFKMNGTVNRHNCVYYASSNPHVKYETPNTQLGVTVWCGVTSHGVVGPYFFEERVNGTNYLHMLHSYVWPQVMRRRLIFQHDGAPAHYALEVRNWLNAKFPQGWIGRRGAFEWPPRSPDLTVADFFLWGYLKEQVYKEAPRTVEDLKNRIQEACEAIPAAVCRNSCRSVLERLHACKAEGGGHLNV